MASSVVAGGGEPLVLGIETSCDETGVALVRGRELLVDTVASSMDEHARYGGIIPEVASRAHLEAMIPTLERSLGTADVDLSEVDAIAVYTGDGPTWGSWRSNAPRFSLAELGPRDINFEWYTTWQQRRVLVLETGVARSMGIVP